MSGEPHLKLVAASAAPSTMQELLADLRQAGERVHAQDALGVMAAFFDSLPIPAWIRAVDADGSNARFMKINRALELASGITSAEVMADPYRVFLDPETQALAVLSDKLAASTRRPLRVDFLIHNRFTQQPVRLVGHKWAIPGAGDIVALCEYGQVSPIK